MSKRKVGYDIGHGKNTYPPSKGVPQMAEFEFNNAVGKYIKPLAEFNGIEPVFAQPFDTDEVILLNRTNKYISEKVELIISIHADFNLNKDAYGHWAFYWHTDSKAKKLAEIWNKYAKELLPNTNPNRSIHPSTLGTWSNFYMCRVPSQNNIPSILCEHGFMSNTNDLKFLLSDEYRKLCAEVAVKTTCEYLGISFRKPEDTVVEKRTVTTSTNLDFHIVEKGDTLWAISQKYGVTLEEIEELNKGIKSDELTIGSKVYIKSQSNVTTYTIQRGDTLWAISQKVGVTVATIQSLNPNVNPEALQIGTVLTISTTSEVVTPPQPKPVEVKPTPTPVSTSKKYTLVKDVNGYTTAANAKNKVNEVTTVKKGEYFIFNESQGMINVTTKDKVAGTWINPSENVLVSAKINFKVNQKVKIKGNAKTYATGQSIPNSVKGKTYTILQVNSDRVLLREIMSWVRKSDVE